MKRIIVILFSFNLCVVAAQASDFYVGVNLGVSQFDGTADADQNAFVATFPPPPLAEISINGLPFESTETSWGVYAGWFARKWLALELGYVALGNSGRTTPGVIFPGGVSAFGGASLNVEEWYFGTRFVAPLSKNISANWIVGITRANFESQGSLPVAEGPLPFVMPGFPVQFRRVPFASPEDETGLVWGFGFEWDLNTWLALDLGYRQHNTRVIDIDTLNLAATFSIPTPR